VTRSDSGNQDKVVTEAFVVRGVGQPGFVVFIRLVFGLVLAACRRVAWGQIKWPEMRIGPRSDKVVYLEVSNVGAKSARLTLFAY